MENQWATNGKTMGNKWEINEKQMGRQRGTNWKPLGKPLENNWETNGSPLDERIRVLAIAARVCAALAAARAGSSILRVPRVAAVGCEKGLRRMHHLGS